MVDGCPAPSVSYHLHTKLQQAGRSVSFCIHGPVTARNPAWAIKAYQTRSLSGPTLTLGFFPTPGDVHGEGKLRAAVMELGSSPGLSAYENIYIFNLAYQQRAAEAPSQRL